MLGPHNIASIGRNQAHGMRTVRNIQVDQAVLVGLHIKALACVHLTRDGAPKQRGATCVDQAHDGHPASGLVAAAQLQALRDTLAGQLEDLAGPHRELPRRRAHELFEQQVAAAPDAGAAVHRDQRWTYRELNALRDELGLPPVRGAGDNPMIYFIMP